MSAASTSREPKASAAGIVQRADTQQRVIPESRRADGSIRKERKVRPGFTPVEDVVRYRPGRAREAEEARRRAVPGSVPSPAASTPGASSSTTSPDSQSAIPSALADTTRTSRAAASATISPGKDTAQRPRGNFAPLEPQKTPSRKDASSDKSATVTSGASSSEAKPWRNSRLRRPVQPTQSQHSSAEPDARDQDEGDASDKSNQTKGDLPSSKSSPSADDLADELDSLRIDKGNAAQGKPN
ncbi:Exon junction complex, Pym [Kalmanozyma brasiliensis GHG001]|uniref:Exon junction complex, Pym n=1 Tax=Kalmanozyma brasiliensis (strain GHG001) TaxID=1365824 RepID=UPI002867D5A7|nr:Exon junction complex, Pym [Kalmanozyma brasiliensis GHG001]KAF6766991.1 Exon junction complex, Pym [Kalmanozyma brasiliensis GHG001]